MNIMRSMIILALLAATVALAGCAKDEPKYGTEQKLFLVSARKQTWAIAPAVNLSGERQVDPILQADLVYQQLQQVKGLTIIPVNRVAEVYASLGIAQVQSEEQAGLVCEMLGCDRLLVPTVTIYDPYNPPKLGASLQLFKAAAATKAANVDPRELTRQAAPPADASLPAGGNFVQVVAMYDAANGSVREALFDYAKGRNDPVGPYGAKEYLVSMDRYCGFVYHELIVDLLNSPRFKKQ